MIGIKRKSKTISYQKELDEVKGARIHELVIGIVALHY